MRAARASSSLFAAAWPCARCAANLTCALLARAREEEGKDAGRRLGGFLAASSPQAGQASEVPPHMSGIALERRASSIATDPRGSRLSVPSWRRRCPRIAVDGEI